MKKSKFQIAFWATLMTIVAVVSLFAVTSTYTDALPNTNLLSDPGFETWSSGMPTGWIKYGTATTITQSTDAHSGKYSVKIGTTSKPATTSGISDGTTPTISSTYYGVAYTASCWAKVSTAMTVSISLHETKQNGTSVNTAATSLLAIPLTTKWYQFQVSYTAIASGDRLPLSIYSANTVSGGATFELDDCSLTEIDTTPPTTPTNLSATVVTPEQVKLTWTGSTDDVGVAGYNVMRNNIQIGNTPANTTSYTDSSANPGTSYTYTIIAFDGTWNLSSPSSGVTVKTPFVPPSAPTKLTATAASPTQVNLSWTAAVQGTGTITGYQVTCNGKLLGTITTTNYNYTSASPSTLYSCSVTVVDSNLLTVKSSVASVTTPALVPPSAPTNLTSMAASPSQFSLNWTASTQGTGAITGYQVSCNGTLLATVTATSYVDTSATPNTSYNCSVTAIDSNLLTSPSSTISVTTPVLVPPSAPTNLTVTATSPVQIDLSWTAAVQGSGTITGYQVTCNNILLATVTTTSYDYTSASPSTLYNCSVTSTDSFNSTSTASTAASDTTPANYTTPYTTTEWDTALSAVVDSDVTQSVTLPNGTVLWVFGDTTAVNGVSTVSAYGYPRDSFVTQQPGTLNFTAVPGSYGYGWQQVPNWSDGSFFWMSTPVVDQGVLYVLGERVDMVGSSYTVLGDYIATFNAQTLAFQSITAAPGGSTGTTLWTGITAAPGGWWVTGTHGVTCIDATDCDVGDAAFVPTGDIANSSAWQISNNIIPASYNIGNDLTGVMVSPTDWVMYTKLGGPDGGTQIEQLTGTSIDGPWTVTGEWAAPSPAGTITYGSSLHLEQSSAPGQALLSYNVNGGTSSQYHSLFEYLPL